MTKTLTFLLKISIFCFLFVSQIIFFTNFSKDPFIIQNLISVAAILGALFLLVLQLKNKEEQSFSFNKLDIYFLVFITISLLSFIINLFSTNIPVALLNNFSRRGFILITGLFGAYFLARLLCNNYAFLDSDIKTKINYRNGFLFLLWGILWIPFSHFKTDSLFDVYGLLMWGLAFYIAFRILKTINIRNILDILLLTSVLASLYGIFQTLRYDLFWTFDFYESLGSIGGSTFGNPNFLASFLLLTLPLSIIFYLSAKSKAEQIYYLIINLTSLTYMAISQTRSAWIGLFFAFLILIISKSFRELLLKNKIKLIVLITALGFIFLMWPQHKTKVDKVSDVKNISQSIFSDPKNLTLAADRQALNTAYHQRLMAWSCGLNNVKKKPLLGWGWGSWQLSYAPCQGELLKKYPALEAFKIQSNSAHNLFIEILAQSGILGLLIYLLFLFLTVLGCIKYYKKQKNLEEKIFFLGILASSIGFLADSILNISFQLQVICSVFYFFIGVLASLNKEDKKIKISSAQINLLLIFIAVLFLFFSFKHYKRMLSSYYSLKGYSYMKRDNYIQARKNFQTAVELSKSDPETFFVYFKTLERLKDFPAMDMLLYETLDYFPYYFEFYDLRAGFEANLNHPEKAFSYLKQSLDLHPYFSETFRLILNFFTDFKELRTLQNAHYLETLRPPLSYRNTFNLLLWQIYFENKDYEKARDILLAELARNKVDQNIQEKLALVNNVLKIKKDPLLEEAQALTALRKQVLEAKEIKPSLFNRLKKAASGGNLEEQMLLAQAYYKQQDYQNCRLILTNLYGKYADFLPLNFAFASLEEAQGNKEEAKKYLRAILLQDSKNELALRRLKILD